MRIKEYKDEFPLILSEFGAFNLPHWINNLLSYLHKSRKFNLATGGTTDFSQNRLRTLNDGNLEELTGKNFINTYILACRLIHECIPSCMYQWTSCTHIDNLYRNFYQTNFTQDGSAILSRWNTKKIKKKKKKYIDNVQRFINM